MAIDAVFRHCDGVCYNEVFALPKQFLRAVRTRTRDELINAVDYERAIIIHPSTLPDYKRAVSCS